MCPKLVVLFILILNITSYIHAKCVKDEQDHWNLKCVSQDLDEVNNQTDKDRYRTLVIQGYDLQKIEKIEYPSITRLEIVGSNTLEEVVPNGLENLELLEYLTIEFTILRIIKQKSFNNLNQLIELHLASNAIKKIELGSFESLPELVLLDLSHNKIKKLEPGIFDNLSNLKILKLNSNLIQKITENLFLKLYYLQEFDLSYNKINSIPDGVFKSTQLLEHNTNYKTQNSNLEVLRLGGNSISILTNQSFAFLPFLKSLELSQSKIQEIEANAFSHLIRLENLDISTNPIGDGINKINFEGLKKLKTLRISFCKINKLDGKIFAPLKKLDNLDLSINNIEEISWTMFNYTSHLKALIISSNKVKYISANTFDNLRELKELSMATNQIEEIESGAFLQLKNLLTLNLNSNKLTELKVGTFDSIRKSIDSIDVSSRLIILDLGHNPIKNLFTDAFDPLTKLNILLLTGNKITEIPENFFRKMTNLQQLNLGYNELKNLPEDVFEPLGESLLELDLSSNKFEFIKADTFKPLENLVSLKLKRNLLRAIDKDTFNLPALRTVNLLSNRLTYLPPDLLHGDDCVVEDLSVYNNRLTFIEDEFFENTKLKSFQFGRNPWICKCLDNMVNILNSKNIQYYAQELSGGQPSCVVGPNNTCIHDLNNSDELFKQYNVILQKYPIFCSNPELC